MKGLLLQGGGGASQHSCQGLWVRAGGGYPAAMSDIPHTVLAAAVERGLGRMKLKMRKLFVKFTQP